MFRLLCSRNESDGDMLKYTNNIISCVDIYGIGSAFFIDSVSLFLFLFCKKSVKMELDGTGTGTGTVQYFFENFQTSQYLR